VLFKRTQIAVKTKTFPALMSRLPFVRSSGGCGRAKPPQVALGQECQQILGMPCLVENILFWYTTLPRDTHNSPEVLQGKGGEPAFLAGLGRNHDGDG